MTTNIFINIAIFLLVLYLIYRKHSVLTKATLNVTGIMPRLDDRVDRRAFASTVIRNMGHYRTVLYPQALGYSRIHAGGKGHGKATYIGQVVHGAW